MESRQSKSALKLPVYVGVYTAPKLESRREMYVTKTFGEGSPSDFKHKWPNCPQVSTELSNYVLRGF